MTHELDQLRDRNRDHDGDHVRVDRNVPGRRSTSAAMDGPAHPIVSGLISRKGDGATSDHAEEAVGRASGGGGHELPGDLRTKFESSLQTDLSSVRVHTGGESQAATEAVGARAYATGNDIHFGAGQYDPHSDQGQHLIAHEVAHTVQQRGGSPTRQNKLTVSQPSDAFEVEADRAASAMVIGARTNVGSAGGMIARDKDPAAEEKAKEKEKAGGASGEADMSIKNGKVTAAVKGTFKTPVYHVHSIAAEMQGAVSVSGSVSAEQADKSASKATPEQAAAFGLELAKDHSETDAKPEDFVTGYEIEMVESKTTKSTKKVGASWGFAPSLTIKTKRGDFKAGITILSVDASTKKVEIEVAKMQLSQSIDLYKIPENTVKNGLLITGGFKMDVSWTVTPDKAEIVASLIKKAGTKLFGDLAKGSAEGLSEAVAAPAMIGAVGAYITVKATLATLQDAQEIKHVAAAAEQAVYGYAGGFSAAAGGANVAGDPAWHGEGFAHGTNMLNAQVARIGADPRFSSLPTEEVRTAIKQGFAQAGRLLYDTVYQGSFARIKEAYVQEWEKKLSFWDKTFTNTKGAERDLRTRMGVSKPAGEAATMPDGAETGLDKEEE